MALFLARDTQHLTNKGLHDRLRVHGLQVVVVLACANENDRLPGCVDHRYGCSHFLIDCIELGQNDAIDQAGFGCGGGILLKSLSAKNKVVEYGCNCLGEEVLPC